MEIQGYPNYLIFPEGYVVNSKGKILKSNLTNMGYEKIILYNKGKGKTINIHRLVAEHYIPNPENKPEVDHIDRNKCNNDVRNLRWVTQSENNQNKDIISTNKTGIKHISYNKRDNIWTYIKEINKKRIVFSNRNKNIVLWIKFYDYIILKYNI